MSHLHKYSDPFLSTLLKHLWQRLQPRVFLGLTLQAWHTCIWGVSPILLCKSFHAQDGERCCTVIFRSLQTCSIGFKSRLWLGHSRTFRDFSRSHAYIFRCLLANSKWAVMCLLLRSGFCRATK
jgi:hypothetical protein